MEIKKDGYTILELDYSYIFTIRGESVTIDNIGYHKAQAKETLHDLHTNKSYKDCFNYLLQKDRKIVVWSDDPRIKEYSATIHIGDDNEPAKKPRELNSIIEKDEIFTWYSYTQYSIQLPTKEMINEVRDRHWWDSKDKPAFCFYHGVRQINSDKLSLYVPKWLAQYDFSYTYHDYNVDTTPLDETMLNKNGLIIRRRIEENANPYKQLVNITPARLSANFDWDNSYSRIGVEMSLHKPMQQYNNAVMTVGLLMPETKVWKKNTSIV